MTAAWRADPAACQGSDKRLQEQIPVSRSLVVPFLFKPNSHEVAAFLFVISNFSEPGE